MRSGLTIVAIVGLGCARTDGDPPRPPSEAPATTSTQLPTWFGLPSAPARRIAGQLWDGEVPLAGTVQLRLAAPDATVWAGIDQRTKPDGSFDFGELRAGRYVVLATAAGKTSRVVELDTLEAAARDLALYAYRCKPITRAVIARGRPLHGARVDVGGVVLATTDRAGKFTVCASAEPMVATIRAAGWSAESIVLGGGAEPSEPDELTASVELAGDVIEKNGKPAIGVAVQVIGETAEQGEPIQATTDSTGRFTVRGAPERDRATGELARYNVRIIDGTSQVTDRTAVLIPRAESPAHAKLAYAHHAPPRAAIASTLTGRILHAGRPLADARVRVPDGTDGDAATTRTRRDGTFELALRARGARVLQVDHPTGLATARTIVVSADALALTIELATTGTIAGVALDRAGKPLARGLIQLRSRDTAVERFVAPGRGGHFAIADVELEQTYDLAVTDGDTGEHATREVTLDAARPNVTALHLTTGR